MSGSRRVCPEGSVRRLEYDAGSGDAIVKKTSVPVEEGAEEPRTKEYHAQPSGKIAQHRLKGPQSPTVAIDDTQFPCLHGQCLTTVEPEPDEIEQEHQHEMDPKEASRRPLQESGENDLRDKKSDQENAKNDQRLIQETGEEACQTWAPNGHQGAAWAVGVAADLDAAASDVGLGSDAGLGSRPSLRACAFSSSDRLL